ncbi:MAG: hypothetical protein ACO3E0_02405 [Candidatus Kapaibacteriota bacterium]
MQRRRPRRRIEIYFVLYLVALVLLMPDRPSPEWSTDSAQEQRVRFDLRPNRLKLSCELQRDTTGQIRLVHVDSVNLVYLSGDVDNVTVRARIEDDRTGQVTMIEPSPAGMPAGSSLFELVPLPDRQTVAFYWRPYLGQVADHRFRVTILGTGQPVRSGSSSDRDARGLKVTGSTQFVLETTVRQQTVDMAVRGTVIDTIVMANATTQPSTTMASDVRRGTFWVAPASLTIRATPGSAWTNRLTFGGADPFRDLKSLPKVRVSIPGVVVERLFDSLQQAVLLRGRIPLNGAYDVSIAAERDDGTIAETSFSVEALKVGRLSLPSAMYAGATYLLATQLPDVPGARLTVRLNSEVLVSSSDPTVRIAVPASAAGATLVVERTVGADRLEAPSQMVIQALPAPEIRDVRTAAGGATKRVVVLFYGDRNNDRPSLELVRGNALPPQKLYGNLRAASPNDPNGMTWIEEFDVRRAQPDAPFSFVIRARSPRGAVSATWTEP